LANLVVPFSFVLGDLRAGDVKFLTNPVKALIVPGDLCAGNVFHPSVRTLVEETFPQVSEPPGKSADF